MRKIRSVRLKNFQSHEDTQILFDDYNVIYGSTNSGKSAIIRGIKWCLYNVPPAEGVDFRRFGTKETLVTIVFDDDKKITRRRTAKENEYILESADGTKTSYSQFGRGPLKEVMDFHGMYQVNLFGNPQSVNIVDQSEPPFFLSQGPTARGHLISRLAGTLLYESAHSLMKKSINEYSKQIEDKTKSIDALDATIESLKYIPDLKKFLDYAEDVDKSVNSHNLNKERASSLVARIVTAADIKASNVKKSEFVRSFDDAQSTMTSINECLQNITRVNNYIDALKQHFEVWSAQKQCSFSKEDADIILNELTKLIDAMALTQSLDMICKTIHESQRKKSDVERKLVVNEKYQENATQTVNMLERCNNGLDSISSKYWNIYTLRQKLCDRCLELEDIENSINQAEKNYKSALLEAQVCPTCNQIITEDVLRGIKL